MADGNEVEFYVDFYVNSSAWNTSYPNEDEATRAGKILTILSKIRKSHGSSLSEPILLDIGCGRGWLTNLLSGFGHVVGIDPVEPVIHYARSMFPALDFSIGTPQAYLEKVGAGYCDIIVASEVIEHVPPQDQISFLR